jgi:ParB-like chromosome segregation protein Spo0J
VRELTDAEVLEIQVVENLQRADLHELEEAEGYEQLLKCTHPSGERYTVDEIAAKVGKSRSYVFARLKLCALCPEARKAFYAGELDASKRAAHRAHRPPRHAAPGAEGRHEGRVRQRRPDVLPRGARAHPPQRTCWLSSRAVRHQGRRACW